VVFAEAINIASTATAVYAIGDTWYLSGSYCYSPNYAAVTNRTWGVVVGRIKIYLCRCEITFLPAVMEMFPLPARARLRSYSWVIDLAICSSAAHGCRCLRSAPDNFTHNSSFNSCGWDEQTAVISTIKFIFLHFL